MNANFTHQEIVAVFAHAKSGKSVGYDNIPEL